METEHQQLPRNPHLIGILRPTAPFTGWYWVPSLPHERQLLLDSLYRIMQTNLVTLLICIHSVSAVSLENVNMPVHSHRTLGAGKSKVLTIPSTGQEVRKSVIIVNLTPQMRNFLHQIGMWVCK